MSDTLLQGMMQGDRLKLAAGGAWTSANARALVELIAGAS